MATQKPTPLEQVSTEAPNTGPSTTSTFPQDLPPRPDHLHKSWKDRNCPTLRFVWGFSLRSYNPRHCPDKRTMFRRLIMLYILVIRTGMAAVYLLVAFVIPAEFVVYCIVAVISIWFVAAHLAQIGDAVGERRVFGKLIGRKHLDWFLYGIALIQSVLVVISIIVDLYGGEAAWLAVWLVIFLVAWVCSWPPEYPPTYLNERV